MAVEAMTGTLRRRAAAAPYLPVGVPSSPELVVEGPRVWLTVQCVCGTRLELSGLDPGEWVTCHWCGRRYAWQVTVAVDEAAAARPGLPAGRAAR